MTAPVVVVTQRHGEWRCGPCGGELGAYGTAFGPQVQLPAECSGNGCDCAFLALRLLESLYDEHPGVC